MNVLSSIIGVEAHGHKETEDYDAYTEFLAHSGNPKLQVNQALLKELNELDKRHTEVIKTLQDLIPPLKQYYNDLNIKLKSLTSELSSIRSKSSELNKLLVENSSKLKSISPIVNDLIISPEVAEQIIAGHISSQWLENVAYVEDKKEIYVKYKAADEVPSDFEELRQTLDILQTVILERCKKFIVARIKALRSANCVPSQKIQTQLLEVAEIFQFIVKYNYSLALELRQAYAYTMQWYYKNYFGRYIRSLTILQYVPIDSHYALGQGLSKTPVNGRDSLGITGFFSKNQPKSPFGSTAATNDTVNEYFQVDKRISILTQEDNTVMVSQIAENNHVANFLEKGFKNLSLAILDNCAVEFMFLNDFFRVNNNVEDLRGILEQVFKPTFEQANHFTKQLISSTFDIFGVLICIRIAHHLQFESQRRRVPVIDDFLGEQLIILWPKFQQLVDFQCESLRNMPIFVGAVGTSALPHELTVQFAKFLTSILTLSLRHQESIDERSEPLYNSIIRIRNDFETVMTKCSKKAAQPEKFLAVNYTYLLNALQQQHISMENGGDASGHSIIFEETKTHFNTLVEAFSKAT
ncbi:LAMI_0B06722g1_1 [Lachancea mirantina]|uniref:LAMI_0B06722g1_1 n=1 Tax=Lachancea mirantina TaxID=1230905 RepID=A0A1G4IWR5_9SACH|nr:LAMI_0B06722g1_1 [Lachancea mirantina]